MALTEEQKTKLRKSVADVKVASKLKPGQEDILSRIEREPTFSEIDGEGPIEDNQEEAQNVFTFSPGENTVPLQELFDRERSNVELIERDDTVDTGLTIVEGFEIKPGVDPETLILMSEMVHSYIGVTPRKMDPYVNRWLTLLGCVVAPIKYNEEYIDEDTGEILTRERRFKTTLFKINHVDELTGMHVILNGGGAAGMVFARELNAIFGPGDLKRPREMFISQEARERVNIRTGNKEPGRLYRFMHRTPKQQ